MKILEYIRFYKSNLTLLVLVIFLLLHVSCDKEVSRSPLEPEPSKGAININSIPQGSLIILNGKNTGRITPDSLISMEPGDYQLIFKRKYYKDTSVVINLGQDEKREIVIDYLSNPSMYGNVILQTAPAGANIYLNDSLLINRTTPDTLKNLLPGEYKFSFQLNNHRDITLSGFVESSKTNIYSSTLRDTSVWVDYNTQNSEIYSDLLTCIDIDLDGKKWIGTNDVGIIVFDNEKFTYFSKINSSIPSNKINAMKVSPSNEIWACTDEGVCRYINSNWLVYSTANSGLENNNITSINFDLQGNTWVGTTNGIAKFNGSTWEHFKYNSAFVEFLWVNDFAIDNNDNLWIGTSNYGIVSYSGSVFTEYHSEDFGFPTNKITAAAPDFQGNIWFGHNSDNIIRGGLSYYDGSSFTSIIFGSVLIRINEITTDVNYIKWVSSNEGLFKINNQNNLEEVFNRSNSLISSNSVIASTIDNNGVVWIATFGGGLNKYKPSQ